MTLTTSYQKIATSSTVSFNGATGKIELYAKYNSQSTANNSTNYSIQPRLVVANGYIGEYTGTTLTISGTGLTTSTTSKGTGDFKSQTLGTLTGTVTHNADGTKSVSMSSSIKFKAWGKTISVSGSATLPTIPRYFTTAPKVELQSKTETTATFKWSTSETCDRIDYAIDGGSGITCFTGSATSGTFTVSGLGANTSHSLFIWGRRKDSQLGTTGNTVSFTTYNYPHITTSSNFVIGNNIPVTLYNPLGRTVSIKFYGNNNTLLCSASRNINGATTIGSTASEITAQYNSIPKATSAKFKITVTYGSAVMTRDAGNTYSIDASKCTPTFNDFTYADQDTTILPLTGNNQILVNGNSDCLFTISSTNKAVGKNSASITKYICQWGNSSNEVAYSSSEDVTQHVYDSTGGTLKVTAVDSRGLTTTVTKNISYVPYVSAVINSLETERKDGVDSKTFLKGKITIYGGSWNVSSDADSINRLKYVGYSVYINNVWSNYYDLTSQIINKARVSESGNNKIYEFDFDDEIELHANGTSGGFTVGTEYQIKFLIKDGNSSTIFTPYSYQAIYNTDVSDGTVAISVHKDSNGKYHFGMNCMSDNNCMFKANNIPLIDNNGNFLLDKYLLEREHPIGSLYFSINSTSPATLFGGTWEKMTGGFIYGCVSNTGNGNGTGTSTGASSGSTGGPSNNTSGSTTLTTNQIPSHTHPHYVRAIYQYKNGDTGAVRGSYESGATTASTGATGGGQGHTHGLSSHTHSLNSHTHDVPYIAVFVWRRTA